MSHDPTEEARINATIQESRTKGLAAVKQRDSFPKDSPEWKKFHEEAVGEYRKFTSAKSALKLYELKVDLHEMQEKAEARKKGLPTTKDPELAKKQAEAEIQKQKGEIEDKVQEQKEKAIDMLKSRISSLAPSALALVGSFVKLPVIDPKILATISFLKELKKMRDEKQKKSKQNVKDAKDKFTYPIKPPAIATKLTATQELTKLPKIEPPKLPQIPVSRKFP